MFKLKPHIAFEWEQIKSAARNLIALFQRFTGGQPTATVASGKSFPLRLDLQFFAEAGEGDPPGGDDPNKKKPEGDPPPPDDEELTLADLYKSNPNIKAEVKDKIEKAVLKRFKDIDPEEARAAIAEKREREQKKGEEGKVDEEALRIEKEKSGKFESKAKDLAIREYAVSNGLDAKLISRLAANEIKSLQLDDNLEADPDDLGEIVDKLKDEFPNLFEVSEEAERKKETPPAGRFNAGSSQKTNQPPKDKDKGISATEESYARIKNKIR